MSKQAHAVSKDTRHLPCKILTEMTTGWENRIKADRWQGGLDRGWGGGGVLGMAYAHSGIWNDWPMRTCCTARGILPNILVSSRNLKENGCVYMGNRITLSYSRNFHNIVNQLYLDKT